MKIHEALRNGSGIIHGPVPEILREEHGAWNREHGSREIGNACIVSTGRRRLDFASLRRESFPSMHAASLGVQ